ncbi:MULTISPECIES: hypothetical protein [Bradyrhizobium]|uniref:hypothetical protein n=1 Tax=Bradyrhizobium TaxID=374 RepID=UPI001E3BD83E|nr:MULTISPECIES: hypothetical protein [Bradyrhizobium]UFW51333.1 hypothetical protein BaraCB756_10235 [Bradyrhizobium arachidis]
MSERRLVAATVRRYGLSRSLLVTWRRAFAADRTRIRGWRPPTTAGRVWREMCFRTSSAGAFPDLNFCFSFAPGGYDKPKLFPPQNLSISPTRPGGEHRGAASLTIRSLAGSSIEDRDRMGVQHAGSPLQTIELDARAKFGSRPVD